MQFRDEDGQWTSLTKHSLGLDGGDGAVNRLSFEWLPQNCAIENCEVRFSRARPDSARRYVVDVHYAHNVIFPIATALQVRIELILQSLIHTVAKERRMYADLSFEISEEKHGAGARLAPLLAGDDRRGEIAMCQKSGLLCAPQFILLQKSQQQCRCTRRDRLIEDCRDIWH